MTVDVVAEPDLPELLGLLRGYCDFYAVAPSDDALLALAVMNDLFVAPAARGSGAADALIAACRERARAHGATWLGWQTAKDNHRAQRVYDRAGAEREEWFDYGLRP